MLAAVLAAALVTLIVFSHVQVRSDMASLLPAGETEASQLMLRELRSGVATSLILIGVDEDQAGENEALAQTSNAMATTLRQSGLFTFVSNGHDLLNDSEQRALFGARYLLSPAVREAAFTTAALQADFERLLQGLESSASPMVTQFGLPDPTGAFPAMIGAWAGDSHAHTDHGVWFASDRPRALLIARMRDSGSSLTDVDSAIQAVEQAFAATQSAGRPAQTLVIAGPAVFARDAAHTIRADVELISIVSTLLVVMLLVWRFRSPWVIAAIAVPLMLATAVAALVVQLMFGFLHGITLGFGMTMLGVTVDYPVLLIGHRKRGEAASGTLRRIGRAFTLAVLTATFGLTGMALSRFPGLSQLGVFAVTGVLTAALATRWGLPRLIVAADLAPVSEGDPRQLQRIERLRRGRGWCLFPVAAAACLLLVTQGPRWESDLGRLSPTAESTRALDANLRMELGAPEVGQVVIIRADTAEAVLRREETLSVILDRLRSEGVISGAEYASRFFPSVATQRARQAALPAPDVLATRIAEAAQGLPFTPEAFAVFQRDVAASRSMTPLTSGDIDSAPLAARIDALLFERDGQWFGIIAPQGVSAPDRLAAAFANQNDVTYVDVGEEMNRMVAAYTRQAVPWLAVGSIAAIATLLIGLRDPWRVMRIVGSVGAALLVTVASLTIAGVRLSLIHLVSLQFVAGVGLDYALFFARPQLDEEERSRTLRTLVTCNGMALLTFGLLCLCRTPLLRAIGMTVAPGVVLAMVFAFLLAGPLTKGTAQNVHPSAV